MINILKASQRMQGIVKNTPLNYSKRLSEKYNCNIYLKREDLQEVRSFKLRGAFNKIVNLSNESKENGVVCASAGNHAQGFGFSCSRLNIKGDIFVPENTPLQKLDRIKKFGDSHCNLHLVGSNFNECLEESLKFTKQHNKQFVHPYDDIDTIIGQGTIANEIYQKVNPDMIIGTIGGGGMMSGIGMFSKEKNPSCLIIGAEPESCPSMKKSIDQGKRVKLEVTDNFVDGATVSQIGETTFELCQQVVDQIYVPSLGRICQEMLSFYQNDGIVVEPAGALPTCVLDMLDPKEIEGRNIVCILSGGNNDITRYPDVMERFLRNQGLKHYYIVEFGQKPGELRKFINNILGPEDDITRFEYIKKTNKSTGNVLIGIQLVRKEDVQMIETQLIDNNFNFIKINENDLLYSYLV